MIGSIVLRADPVKKWERYARTLVPLGSPGPAALYFSEYSPQDRAEGGYWSARFRVHGRENLLKELYEQALGRHVEAWGYGLEPDFEGRVIEVVFTLPPDVFTINLDLLANRSLMRADTNADGVVDRSTTFNDTVSQGRYGISEIILAGGEVQGTTVANQAVQSFINLRAFAQPLANLGGAAGAQTASVELFCRGFWHTLGMRTYNQTAITGTQSMTAQVRDIVNTAGEFIAAQELDANTTVVTREHDADRKPSDIIADMASMGDADNNRWLVRVFGRSATNVTGRRLYLVQAAPVVQPPAI